MSEEEDIKTTITVPSDLLWKFREEAPKRRMTFKGAVAQAFERWLYGAMPATAGRAEESTSVPVPLASNVIPELQSQIPASRKLGAEPWGKYQQAHEDLDYILDRGPGGMPEDILGNIGWFALAAKVANGDAPPSALSRARTGKAEAVSPGVERALEAEQRYLTNPVNPDAAQERKKPPKKKSG